ncbi:MAG: HAD hydrolase-like protein, partial [Mucispirillum sp.]|nr:HAD hydrolase-like protein [Mucispirillum sp.]
MRYTLIIFDLDGTLLDTSAGALKSIDFTIDILGLAPLSDEVKKSFIGPPIYDSLKNTYGMDDILAAKATAIFRDVYKNNFLYEAEIYKDMESVLSSLKNRGYKLAVATYKREDYAAMLIERFNLSRYFDFIKGADNEGILKKQDIAEMCIAYCGAEKERSVLIGDTH